MRGRRAGRFAGTVFGRGFTWARRWGVGTAARAGELGAEFVGDFGERALEETSVVGEEADGGVVGFAEAGEGGGAFARRQCADVADGGFGESLHAAAGRAFDEGVPRETALGNEERGGECGEQREVKEEPAGDFESEGEAHGAGGSGDQGDAGSTSM